jgi:hypothetical protein
MQRIRLFALAIALIIVPAHPASLLSQDNSTKETYDGVPLCHNRRGVFPRRIHTPDPEYDDQDRKKKIQGTVTLSAILTTEGKLADIKVKKKPDSRTRPTSDQGRLAMDVRASSRGRPNLPNADECPSAVPLLLTLAPSDTLLP